MHIEKVELIISWICCNNAQTLHAGLTVNEHFANETLIQRDASVPWSLIVVF